MEQKPTTQKFTETEMSSVLALQKRYQEKLISFGQLSLERMSIDQSIKNLNDAELKLKEEYLKLQKEEEDIIESLSKKYGNGTLNIKDGTFTST